MKINGQTVNGNKFAYDGCHKIYIIEDEQDEIDARDLGYDIYSILDYYNSSCPLRFISNWKLNKHFVLQYEDIVVE